MWCNDATFIPFESFQFKKQKKSNKELDYWENLVNGTSLESVISDSEMIMNWEHWCFVNGVKK